MNIPNGFKLVPVSPTAHMIAATVADDQGAKGLRAKIAIDAYKAMLAAAPTPPQPICDEAAEQEAFEAVNPMPDQVTKFKGGYAPTGYSAWDAQDFCKKWDGWKQCAQSRAKAGEVGHE